MLREIHGVRRGSLLCTNQSSQLSQRTAEPRCKMQENDQAEQSS
jgi:hypothetical protein